MEEKKSGKVKKFFKGLTEKWDKKMKEKAKSSSCCKPSDKDKNPCCS
jgi:hypothetical protein